MPDTTEDRTSTAPAAEVAEAERRAVAQELLLKQLGRTGIPLAVVMVLTGFRVALGTFGSRGTVILLVGGGVSLVTMYLYALPTVIMASGRPRPWWTGITSMLGLIPMAYGLYLGAIGGALGTFRAVNLLEAALGVLFLIGGFIFVRDYSRLAMLGRSIEGVLNRSGPT
jgi:hypothetical protein